MSDPIENTAAGATRTFFGALAFILLMVGVEGMTGVAPLSFFSSLVLLLFGGLFFYAAVFWENAKKNLSPDTQATIGRFAQSRITRFGMLFLVLATLILSPFIEQHRWPFSYRIEPAEIAKLRASADSWASQLSDAYPDAQDWRFAKALKATAGANGCPFVVGWSPTAAASGFWSMLKPSMDMGGWIELRQLPSDTIINAGITVLVNSTDSHLVDCAASIVRELENVRHQHSILRPNEPTAGLLGCDSKCIELDIGLR